MSAYRLTLPLSSFITTFLHPFSWWPPLLEGSTLLTSPFHPILHKVLRGCAWMRWCEGGHWEGVPLESWENVNTFPQLSRTFLLSSTWGRDYFSKLLLPSWLHHIFRLESLAIYPEPSRCHQIAWVHAYKLQKKNKKDQWIFARKSPHIFHLPCASCITRSLLNPVWAEDLCKRVPPQRVQVIYQTSSSACIDLRDFKWLLAWRGDLFRIDQRILQALSRRETKRTQVHLWSWTQARGCWVRNTSLDVMYRNAPSQV